MAGDASVEPILNLGGQIEDFDGHGGSPLQVPGSRSFGQLTRVTPGLGVERDIHVSLTDFNICHSMFRDLWIYWSRARPGGLPLGLPGLSSPACPEAFSSEENAL
jgi:hypothetical protein